ncbi:hypothetical protein ACOMHN_039770 [Nucella lapillus]
MNPCSDIMAPRPEAAVETCGVQDGRLFKWKPALTSVVAGACVSLAQGWENTDTTGSGKIAISYNGANSLRDLVPPILSWA